MAEIVDDDILAALAIEGLGGGHSAWDLIFCDCCGSDQR